MIEIDFLTLALISVLLLFVFIVIIFLIKQKYDSKLDALKLEKSYLEALLQAKEESQSSLKQEFENLANRVFDETSSKSKQNINQILNPFKEQLNFFGSRVNEIFNEETKQRSSLLTEIKNLKELNNQISQDAINLTSALKGQSKTQGDWGEMILSSILEKSGLRAGIEYKTQNSYKDENGKLLRPDIVIHLPSNRDVIIDSKLSLNSYIDYANSQTQEEQTDAQNRVLLSISNHIKDLSSKKYENLNDIKTLDFVLMFIPIEGVFMLANQNNSNIFELATKHNIMLVSPSTLNITLRTIENIWRDERQNENAKEISNQAALLYDKFVAFVEDIESIGISIQKSQEFYNKALNKLSTGRGNLVSKAQKFLDLGVKPNKEINEKYKIKEEDL